MPDHGYLMHHWLQDDEWSKPELFDVDDDRLVLVGSPHILVWSKIG
jgi:hypothetical protein